MTGGQEVKFYEIEICLFYEIEITIMRLKFYLFMRSKLAITFDSFDQEVDTLIMRLKLKKALLANFDHMIVLVTNKSIMRSKLKKGLLGNFDLKNNLLVTSAIMRSKVFMHRWLIISAKN